MDMIWYDSEALNGRGMPTEYAEEQLIVGPKNKREAPCGSCERSSVCMVEFVECKAFRKWCERGTYEDSTVGIALRSI